MLREICSEFAKLVAERIDKNIFTTEDSLRYTFFYSITQRFDIKPYQVVLEKSHPYIHGAKIDSWIESFYNGQDLVMEFKYDRQIPSERNSPRPQKAGKVFNDIYRLIKIEKDNIIRLLIYLTDEEMRGYFKNVENGLVDFFNLWVGEELKIDKNYISTKSNTFQKQIQGPLLAKIKCILSEELPQNHSLRIYKIMRI